MILDGMVSAMDYVPARDYLRGRNIPDPIIQELYCGSATDDLDAHVDATLKIFGEDNTFIKHNIWWLKEGVEVTHGGEYVLAVEPRVYIPYYNTDKELVGMVTRSLTDYDHEGNRIGGFRYQGINYSEDQLIYNIEKVDTSKTFFVCEGEFDAMLLPNAVSCPFWKKLPVEWKDNAIIVYDNDDFAISEHDIIGAEEEGWTVCHWDDRVLEFDDINDMVSGGMEVSDIVKIILECAGK